MTKFALKFPFFILMICLVATLVGVVTVATMPVDLFPQIDIPVVVVATFFAGMPPQQVEGDITNTFERFFTYAANIDHIQSRSLDGVSLIKIFFRPGTDPNSALASISNLAMADLRRLPPGTLPPVVLGMTASSQPVCLVTLKGKGLSQTQLKDIGQFAVRDQIASVKGASIPDPYGGTYRQIQVFVNPLKLEATNLSVQDVVKAVNSSNLILPAGDVEIGNKDYNVYANAQFPTVKSMNSIPLKTVGNSSVLVADVGKAVDSGARQTNIVRIDGQPSVYVPIFKSGAGSNTISIVDGVRKVLKHLANVPPSLKTAVVFDQSVFVKLALHELLNEAVIGLALTALMILLFLGNLRVTIVVLISVPISALVCLMITRMMGGNINTMILGGIALAFSRLIDNCVVVLENIFRYIERGESPAVAAEKGGTEVSLAVLAATITASIVFFPVTMLSGVSKYLFTPLGMGVVLSIFVSFAFAMTVIPIFCAKFIKVHGEEMREQKKSPFQFVIDRFNMYFERLLAWYGRLADRTMKRPGFTFTSIIVAIVVVTAVTFPLLGHAYFPRVDAGQFEIYVKLPRGSRINISSDYIGQVEQIIRKVIPPHDLHMIVSNIGVTHGPSTIYSPNASMDTAFVLVSLNKDRKESSFTYMKRVREAVSRQMPELSTFYSGGGMVSSIMNQGLPSPIEVQITSHNLKKADLLARQLATKIRAIKGVSGAFIPQRMDYPGIMLNINRERAAQIDLTTKDVMDNVIVALTSSGQVEPDYWIDPKSGNNYLTTVQFTNYHVDHMTMQDFLNIPLHGKGTSGYTPLQSVASIKLINTPTEIDHYQLRRVIDIYVATKSESLSGVSNAINKLIAHTPQSKNLTISVHGAVVRMHSSFHSFGIGIILAIVLVYLVLMAQFGSFTDPLIILTAVPPGIVGVVLTLLATGSTMNIMSLMGTIMMIGIVVSNSILIVDFARILRKEGRPIVEATIEACKMRLRPILMTSIATLLGMIPMALGIEPGSEQYAPLARAVIGGLFVSMILTMFLVPAAYLMIHGRDDKGKEQGELKMLEEEHA